MPDRYQDPLDPFAGIGDESVVIEADPSLDVEVTPEGVITTLEDGSVEIRPAETEPAAVEEHDSNLAEFLEDSDLIRNFHRFSHRNVMLFQKLLLIVLIFDDL